MWFKLSWMCKSTVFYLLFHFLTKSHFLLDPMALIVQFGARLFFVSILSPSHIQMLVFNLMWCIGRCENHAKMSTFRCITALFWFKESVKKKKNFSFQRIPKPYALNWMIRRNGLWDTYPVGGPTLNAWNKVFFFFKFPWCTVMCRPPSSTS